MFKVFFVLRKKQNQITFLHVFHHTIMAAFSWCYLKFLPGEQGAIIGFLNSVVHVIMYSYYLIAALGPKYKKYLWWKKYMTWIQLVIIYAYIIVKANYRYLIIINLISYYYQFCPFTNKINYKFIFLYFYYIFIIKIIILYSIIIFLI